MSRPGQALMVSLFVIVDEVLADRGAQMAFGTAGAQQLKPHDSGAYRLQNK